MEKLSEEKLKELIDRCAGLTAVTFGKWHRLDNGSASRAPNLVRGYWEEDGAPYEIVIPDPLIKPLLALQELAIAVRDREAERGKGEWPNLGPLTDIITDSQAYADKVLEVVPWQKCPVCDGHGLVMYPPGLARGQDWSGISSGPWRCECCHGARAIPMVVANEVARKREG